MTPFGARVRELRKAKGVTQADMAAALGVSGAYLSALEHGRRGRPSWYLLQRMIGYLGIIWDEAEELERLADLSHPRITVETGGLSPEATLLANRLADGIGRLTADEIERIMAILDAAPGTGKRETS
ncbi:helix-turn-helix domain-containing protein [Aureimonas frigidaquae]|uniref:Possible transcriptional regulator n=1 Tax=Aureimonas frigidaquae TaxID=424757 RepID=A0A0P0Z1E7_9HYPH|nr:helix-turn-helix domain-containing protein [Aureimonas frigidaquae]BAT27496.1 possible transcriptional regulator [Aureimonas frigidaquae]